MPLKEKVKEEEKGLEEEWQDVLGSGALLRRREQGASEDGLFRPQKSQLAYVKLEGRVLEDDKGNSEPFWKEECLEVAVDEGELRVAGVELALRMLSLGGGREVVRLLPRLGFGNEGAADLGVPPGASLEFSLELVRLGPDPAPVDAMDTDQRAHLCERKLAVGNAAFRIGDLARAQAQYGYGLKLAPDGSEQLARVAMNLATCYARGEATAASKVKRLCQTVLAIQPDHPKALYRCAQAEEWLGNYAAAERQYRSSIDVGGGSAPSRALHRLLKRRREHAAEEREMWKGKLQKEVKVKSRSRRRERAVEHGRFTVAPRFVLVVGTVVVGIILYVLGMGN